MIKRILKPLAVSLLFCVAVTFTAMAAGNDKIMTRQADGTYIVNTTTLCQDVRGYQGATPLKVHIKNDKVVKVEFLPNQETPKYFRFAKSSVNGIWDGKRVKDAKKVTPDARTGATYSVNAVNKNVQAALDYYLKNKGKK